MTTPNVSEEILLVLENWRQEAEHLEQCRVNECKARNYSRAFELGSMLSKHVACIRDLEFAIYGKHLTPNAKE